MITAAIQNDLNWCETLIQNNSSSFYRAFRKLPRQEAQAVFAIYAFCRIADDAIDVDNNPALVRAMAEKLLAFEAGETPDEPMWRALRWAFDSFPLQIRPFQEMLIGQLQDVEFQQPKSFNDLLDYCYLVAGTVGLMLCPLLAKPVTIETEKLSVELGIAMQLTNILRDVGTDYRLKRIYLPEDLMIALGVSPEDLVGPEPTPELIRLWEHLAGEAEGRYRRISANLDVFDKTARLPVLLSLLYYSKIINRCRKARYRCWIAGFMFPNGKSCCFLFRPIDSCYGPLLVISGGEWRHLMEDIVIYHNILGIIVSFIYVFSVIFLARFLERFGKEASRKAVHILVCNWWLVAMIFFDSPIWAAVVPACFVALNYLSYRFQLFSSMERGAGKGDLGTVYYAISLFLLALISFGPLQNPIVGGVGILIMGYGDGLAAVVGTSWPKRPYQLLGAEKTLSGSLTMLVTSFLVTLVLLAATGQPQVLMPALTLALLATGLEAITPLGLDNLTVPLVSAGAYYFIFVR